MGKAEKRPSWFKLFLHQKPLLDAVPDDVVGKAMKAAMQYFENGEVMELDPIAFAVFSTIKPGIDEAVEDFRHSVDLGRRGGKKRWNVNDSPPVGMVSPPIGLPTEAEAEADADAEAEGKNKNASGADRPRSRFAPPSVEDVKMYCTEKGYSMDAEHFVDYYTSNGWRVGRNPMKDWKAAVRNWNKGKEDNRGKNQIQLSGTIGTVL